MAFEGNPNLTITAIDTTAAIAASRTSGKVPCFIHVSGSAVTATGTSVPYEDLEYTWDFGDTSSAETFTNPGVCGGTKNTNTGQTGPEAVHCYRTAGSYTITLTIRGKNGSGYTTATKTLAITVSAFGGTEYYFDSVGGSDANDGLSSGAPKQTISAMNTLMVGTNGRTFHIKRGSSYTGTAALYPFSAFGVASFSGMRIDAYGTGAKPQFNISSGTQPAFLVENGGVGSEKNIDDIVVSNIKFTFSGTASRGAIIEVRGIGNTTGLMTNLYFDNCDASTTVVNGTLDLIAMESGSNITIPNLSKIGMWGCTVTSPQTVVGYEVMGILFGIQEWAFVFGGSIDGGTDEPTGLYDHHIYPKVKQHALFRWITFGQGPQRNHCINCDYAQTDGSYSEYWVIDGCEGTGTSLFCDFDQNSNDPTLAKLRNIVVQKNRIHDLTGDDNIITYSAFTMTVRNNEAWDNIGGRWFGPAPDATLMASAKYSLYGNKVYVPASASVFGAVIAFDNAGWVQLQTITDNTIVDLRSAASTIQVPFTQQAGATIDRNQVYTPNDTTSYKDVSTQKTFAQWQAAGFDLNGSAADPGWPDAPNGDFGTNAICLGDNPPVALTAPTISGNATVGSVLTGVDGTYSGSGVVITHQWRRDGANIAGQTGSTYTTQTADIGHAIDWYELATNSDGTDNQNSNDITVVAASSGGGYAPPIKIKHEKQRRELQKKNQDAIEQTIRLAYQRLTGKVTEPPILQQEVTPERLAVHAEKLAEQLVEKSKNSAKQRERNKAIIADLQRQANAIMQEEEEAIIMLLH